MPLGCKNSSDGSINTVSGPLTILPEYQARAPRTCTPVTTPPSAATATVLVQCSTDAAASGFLGLVQDVKAQIGKSRPFVAKTDATLPAIDVMAEVYPLQGGYTAYLCRPIDNQSPAGQNCIRSVVSAAEGSCYKTAAGDYKCRMYGNPPKMEQGVAGPKTF